MYTPAHDLTKLNWQHCQRSKAKTYQKQKGTILITTLLLMAIAAILATTIAVRLQLSIQQSSISHNTEQAYLAAQYVKYWAQQQLRIKQKQSIPTQLKLSSTTLSQSPTLIVTGLLVDLQGRFNLNNLFEPNYLTAFTRLLRIVYPQLSSGEAETITQQIYVWLHQDQAIPTSSPESIKPNRRWFSHVTELQMIPGVNSALYQQLAPHITALPAKTTINLNTASNPVLQSVAATMTVEQADHIIQLRQQKGFGSVAELVKRLPEFNGAHFLVPVGTDSQFFLIEANVTQPSPLTLFTIVKLISGGPKATLQVVQQTVGAF